MARGGHSSVCVFLAILNLKHLAIQYLAYAPNAPPTHTMVIIMHRVLAAPSTAPIQSSPKNLSPPAHVTLGILVVLALELVMIICKKSGDLA